MTDRGNQELSRELYEAAVEDSLLKRRFYRAWQGLRLNFPGDIQLYAGGLLRPFEAALPGLLRTVIDRCQDQDIREILEGNLRDEEGGDARGTKSHLTLLDDFCVGIGMNRATLGDHEILPAAQRMLDTYVYYDSYGSIAEAVAVHLAYELMSGWIAPKKILGLQHWHVTDPVTLQFFVTHGAMDPGHTQALQDALAMCATAKNRPSIMAAFRAALGSERGWGGALDEVADRCGIAA